jgi:hypothetical protein
LTGQTKAPDDEGAVQGSQLAVQLAQQKALGARALDRTASTSYCETTGMGDRVMFMVVKVFCGCGVVWCGVVWCGVVWCGVVWCDVVWCGVVWCGVVWCGVVWCGVV